MEPPQRPYEAFQSAPTAKGGPLRFVIARDSANHWILMETHGLYGGIFVSKEAAMRFADFECGGRNATLEVIGEDGELEQKNDELQTP